jgi:hypothetical protein
MMIEFRVQLGDGGAVVVQAPSSNPPVVPQAKQLGAHNAPQSGNPPGNIGPGGNPPGNIGPGGNQPGSGSGMVFVLGPIVICGSGPAHTDTGGGHVVSSTSPGGGGHVVGGMAPDGPKPTAPESHNAAKPDPAKTDYPAVRKNRRNRERQEK